MGRKGAQVIGSPRFALFGMTHVSTKSVWRYGNLQTAADSPKTISPGVADRALGVFGGSNPEGISTHAKKCTTCLFYNFAYNKVVPNMKHAPYDYAPFNVSAVRLIASYPAPFP